MSLKSMLHIDEGHHKNMAWKWEKYDKDATKMNTVLGTIQSVQNTGLQLILE